MSAMNSLPANTISVSWKLPMAIFAMNSIKLFMWKLASAHKSNGRIALLLVKFRLPSMLLSPMLLPVRLVALRLKGQPLKLSASAAAR